MKSRVVISIDEVLVAIEAAEEATQNKKKKIGTGKPWGRSRKIQESIVVSEDEDEDSDFLEYENVEVE